MKAIYAEDLLLSVREDPNINGANFARFRQHINEAPAVDAVEVVHAEWLDGFSVDHEGKTVYESIDCSSCDEYIKVEANDREYWKERFKVCPFCGAKMDGDGNER